MGIGDKRKRDVFILLGACLLVGLLAGVLSWFGDNERVALYWVDGELDQSLDARVVEVIEYDFGFNRRHGIFREIPDLDLSVEPIILSRTAPDEVEIVNGKEVMIRIGDPDTLIRGRHTYQIEYVASDLGEGDRVAWDAVGFEWLVGMERAEIHLRAPFELDNAACKVGRSDSRQPCDVSTVAPGHLLVAVESLEGGSVRKPSQGVTIWADVGSSVSLPDPPALPSLVAVDPRMSPFLVGLIGLLASAPLMMPISLAIRYWGREQEVDGARRVDASDLVDSSTSSPTAPDLEPWQAAVILDERPLPRHRTAWLLQRVEEGQVEIEGSIDLTLVAGPAGLRDPLLAPMFGNRERVDLGKQDPTFRTGWKAVGQLVMNYSKDQQLWDTKADVLRRVVRVLGSVVALVGLVVAGLGAIGTGRNGTPGLTLLIPGLVLTGAGIAALTRSWELRVRTPEGTRLWLSIDSFRRYLAEVDSSQVELAAENGIFSQHAAWAVALGEIDIWSAAVNESEALKSNPFAGSRSSYRLRATQLMALERSVTATAASRSSRGGGSGGGGGGGGGSW